MRREHVLEAEVALGKREGDCDMVLFVIVACIDRIPMNKIIMSYQYGW